MKRSTSYYVGETLQEKNEDDAMEVKFVRKY